jgi:hypothetical protein
MTTKPETEQERLKRELEEAEALVYYRQQQSERARVAKFMGCSIDKVVRSRDGGWTTR